MFRFINSFTDSEVISYGQYNQKFSSEFQLPQIRVFFGGEDVDYSLLRCDTVYTHPEYGGDNFLRNIGNHLNITWRHNWKDHNWISIIVWLNQSSISLFAMNVKSSNYVRFLSKVS
jgi:hypothetical protein